MKAYADAALREIFGGHERYRILRTLYEQPGRAMPVRRLAEAAQVDPGNTSKLLKRLAAVGLCERIEEGSRPQYRAPVDTPLQALLTALFAGVNELSPSPVSPSPGAQHGDQQQRELDEALMLLRKPSRRRGRLLADQFEKLQARANAIIGTRAVRPGVHYFKSLAEKNRRDDDLELERAVRRAGAAA